MLYLFHTPPQAKYLFHFRRKNNSVYKIRSQTRLRIDLEVKETSEARHHKFERHLIMPSEERQFFFGGGGIKYLFNYLIYLNIKCPLFK